MSARQEILTQEDIADTQKTNPDVEMGGFWDQPNTMKIIEESL